MVFLGQTQGALRGLPDEVRREIGFALSEVQQGRKHPSIKALSGDKAFKGATVLEIVEDDDGNTYRAVYTLKYEGVIYILHVFQKKSTKGIATPRKDVQTIKLRLVEASKHYQRHFQKQASA